MALISFSNVSKIFNNDLVLDHISFNIFKNEKVALIGNNGTGKTTIFKLILKKIEPSLLSKEDKPGDITILNNISIGYLSQDAISDITHSVREELEMPFEHLKTFEKEFNDLSYKLSLNPSDENLLKKYQIYLEESEHNRVYSYKNEIETMISKFSFDKDILDKKISLLSGGERMKIAFIKLLMNDYDVLLLDEPTNHLDISTIEWLENYLKNYKGTVFFISHDRYFIEALSSKIIELENKKVTTYNTTYENYLVEKENNFKVLLEQSKKRKKRLKGLRDS